MLAIVLALGVGLLRVPYTEALAPYTRPTVYEPFTDGVSQKVPPDLGNRRLAALGFLDVTAAPFSADAAGERDSTEALRRAVVAARDAQMVCFFPPGTYKVSDTLVCIQDLYRRSNGAVTGGRLHPCVLVGSRAGPRRPTIVLAPNSPGFGDPARPKRVVHFWARGCDEVPPTEPQPNISMNQMFVGIDIVIGPGNPGAVALRHRAAQGSGVQDCSIDARHGLAGLEGGAGSGGGHAGVTVIGGRWGLDLRETQPAPTVAGVVLEGQTEAAILCSGRQALTVVGARIVTDGAGPVIRCDAPGWAPHNGQMCLVDAAVECRGPPATVIRTTRSVYLANVWAKGAVAVVAGPREGRVEGRPDGWLYVRECAVGIDPPPWKGLAYRAPVYVDGVRRAEAHLAAVEPAAGPPEDLVARHLWAEAFPHFEGPGVANVKAPPYEARGDGRADDTDALQRAIDAAETVFLPKGYYRVSRTVRLGPRTRLIGAAQHLSMILAREAEGDFADGARPRPVVQTADDAAAETVMAFCGVAVSSHVPGAYALEWRAGGRSTVRSVQFMRRPLHGFSRAPEGAAPRPPARSTVQVRGSGGGRWYNFEGAARTPDVPEYRHLLIDGAAGPLGLYQCNVEYARSDAEMEVRRSRRVSIYGLKGEYNKPILWVRDSDHVRVLGYGGNAAGLPGEALLVVERTPNLVIANAVDSPRLEGEGRPDESPGIGVDPRKWHMIIERPPAGGDVIRTRPMDRPVLYKRGEPKAE